MKTKFLLPFTIVSFLFIFFILYVGLNRSNIYIPDTVTNEKIPTFKVKVFNSEKELNSIEIFENDIYYLLNIWASWCIPCRDEHPYLMELKKNKKLEIVGLNYKDKVKNANNFLNELNNPYNLILSDTDGTIAIEWGAYGVPETFLIYNGKKFIPITVSEDMVGHKFGEFSPTRQFAGHTPADKKAKAEEKKGDTK